MQVTVKLFAMFRDRVGERIVSLKLESATDPTVADALVHLESDYSSLAGTLVSDREIVSTVSVLRNGRLVDRSAADTTSLESGDELVLSSPVTGG